MRDGKGGKKMYRRRPQMEWFFVSRLSRTGERGPSNGFGSEPTENGHPLRAGRRPVPTNQTPILHL